MYPRPSPIRWREEGWHQNVPFTEPANIQNTRNCSKNEISVSMVKSDVMKEDGWHQKIPFTDSANIQKHKEVF